MQPPQSTDTPSVRTTSAPARPQCATNARCALTHTRKALANPSTQKVCSWPDLGSCRRANSAARKVTNVLCLVPVRVRVGLARCPLWQHETCAPRAPWRRPRLLLAGWNPHLGRLRPMFVWLWPNLGRARSNMGGRFGPICFGTGSTEPRLVRAPRLRRDKTQLQLKRSCSTRGRGGGRNRGACEASSGTVALCPGPAHDLRRRRH